MYEIWKENHNDLKGKWMKSIFKELMECNDHTPCILYELWTVHRKGENVFFCQIRVGCQITEMVMA